MEKFKNRNEVLQSLRPLIADTLCAGNGADRIEEKTDLRVTFRVRNAEVARLAEPLTKCFGCRIAAEEARKFQTAGDIIDWLEKKGVVSYDS